jgi:hypothetical protein
MAEFDHGLKRITDTSARELARVAGVACEQLRPLESTLPSTTELLADRAFRASRGRERFVVYFEFYTRWDRNAPWDMLAKSGLLSQRLRLPTVCLAFVLLPRGFRSQGGQLRLAAAGAPTQQLWFREVCLWEVEPEGWWQGAPGLMVLYPLTRHRQSPQEAIRHSAAAIEQLALPGGEQADWLSWLGIFASRLIPRREVMQLIGEEKMRESSFYRGIVGEGERNAILCFLRARFGSELPEDLVARLNRLYEPRQLEPLAQLAATCSRLEEFHAALPPLPAPRRRARTARP